MRYTEIDLQIEDIMWFGVDSEGHIFECTSAGCGNVPEYVCRSREETETLLSYFTEEAPVTTTPELLIPEEDNQLTEDITDLASKGVFCYDITDFDNAGSYSCVAKPASPISITDLPENIQAILSDHLYPDNISTANTINVKHAY